jgi:hypothetical protein
MGCSIVRPKRALAPTSKCLSDIFREMALKAMKFKPIFPLMRNFYDTAIWKIELAVVAL